MPKVLVLLDVDDTAATHDELREVVTQHLDNPFWLPGETGAVSNLPCWVTVAVTDDDPAVRLLFETAEREIVNRPDLRGHAVVEEVTSLAGTFTS